MQGWWKNNRLWLGTYTVLLVCCLIVLFLCDKPDIHLVINRLNNEFLDGFFVIVTEFGAFPLIGAIILSTLFFRYRIALTATISSLIAVVLTQIGKRVIWPDSPRPKILFDGMDAFHVVNGVDLHSSHSFPSGHTSGAFALFIVLALYSKPSYLKLFFLSAAILVAYSRMYLSQHFLVDVTAGSVIGVVSAILAYFWFNSHPLDKAHSLDKYIRFGRPSIG